MRQYLLLFILFLSSFSIWAQVPEFKLNKSIGTPIVYPTGIALDHAGYIYLLEGDFISKLDSTGALMKTFPLNIGRDSSYTSLALDGVGNIYVLNPALARIKKFNSRGELLLEFGKQGSGQGQFKAPRSLSLDLEGNIYVAEEGKNRVQKFSAQGIFIWEFKSTEFPGDWTKYINAVQVGKSGTVYILTNDLRIILLDGQGQHLRTFNITAPGLSNSSQNILVLDSTENIYVTAPTSSSKRIYKFKATGEYLQLFGTDQSITGNFLSIQIGLAISPGGDLYTTDAVYDRRSIQVFRPDGSLKTRIENLDFYYLFSQDAQGNFYLISEKFDLVSPEHRVWEQTVKKFNAYGLLVDQFNGIQGAAAIQVDSLGNIIIAEHGSNIKKACIKKFNSTGQLTNKFEDFIPRYNLETISDMSLDRKGNIYLADYKGGVIHKISPNGKYLGAIGSSGKGQGQFYWPKAVTLDSQGQLYVADFNGDRIQKFSPNGQLLQEWRSGNQLKEPIDINKASLAVDRVGNIYTWNGVDQFIRIISPAGLETGRISEVSGQISLNRQKTKLLVLFKRALVWEFLSRDAPKESLITGKVYQDANGNCSWDTGEKVMPGIMVIAEPGPYYGQSDEQGNYTIPVDTGTYTVRAILPAKIIPGQSITPTCPKLNKSHIQISYYGVSRQGPDLGHLVSNTSVLNVSINSNRRRRCFRNITTVSYSNTGFASASNAKVTVQLPEHIAFISANFPHSKDNKGNYIFAVGNLQPNQRGIITIIDSVSCANPNIRGLTVCTKAWITPVNTYPTPSNWNKAAIAVTGKTVENNQVRFVIRNTGTGNMTDSLYFRIYQDTDLILRNKYKLAMQDSLVLRFAPTGRALRLEADQPEGHPLKATAGANVEMPHMNAMRLPSSAMVAYPPNDPEPEITEDCLPILDSFDPNDKQVIPVGLTTENYTPTNAPLRYTIRFQNTGTDVAYRVVVVDTLSTDLDLSTFQVGAVSHGYRLAVSGKEKPVLTFTFDNIMLPDSTTDLAGSNGFIQFNIKPKPNLPEKTKIENYADIFFDYNEPVRTNTTVNRIFDMPQELIVAKQLIAQNVITTPAIQSFSPTQSRAGKVVTLTGRHFSSGTTGNKVTFNGVAANVVSANPMALTVTVPNTAFTGKIKVVTADGFTQSSTDFIIFQPPTLTAISATEGTPGTNIILTGTHFSPDVTLDTVTFNGVKSKVLEASETNLKVEVPAGATIGKIQVKTLGGQIESTQDFRVWYPPAISDFNPGKGKTGKIITINGNNFAETIARNAVKFKTIPAEIVQASTTQLLVKVPADVVSGKLVVETPGGITNTPTDFTFIPAPVISSFTPTQGYAGTTVTISGNHFNADNQADTVYFNELKAKVLKATSTILEVQAPKGVSTGIITVAGAGGRATTTEFNVPDLTPQDAVDIFPNPSKGELTINWFKANFKVENIEVYNAIGKLVYQKELGNIPDDNLKLTLKQFGAGVYTIRLQTRQEPVVKRIVVF